MTRLSSGLSAWITFALDMAGGKAESLLRKYLWAFGQQQPRLRIVGLSPVWIFDEIGASVPQIVIEKAGRASICRRISLSQPSWVRPSLNLQLPQCAFLLGAGEEHLLIGTSRKSAGRSGSSQWCSSLAEVRALPECGSSGRQ